MSRHFKGKEIHVANTHIERSSKSFSFKEIEIKAAIRLTKVGSLTTSVGEDIVPQELFIYC